MRIFNITLHPLIIVLGLFLLNIGCSEEGYPPASIEFYKGDELKKTVSLDQLLQVLQVHELKLYDVEFKKEKKYKAFLFNDVLTFVYGDQFREGNWTSVSFTATDGYKAVIDLKRFNSDDAYLVFVDMEFNDWEAIPNHGGDKPAPFYLVWTETDHIPKNGYSWPWQIAAISLVKMEDQYTVATPEKDKVSSVVYAGYKLFMSRCNSCHAISGEGGGIGPDLNMPMNILAYRSEEMVRSFIRESSRFRVSRMPDFKDLTDEEVEQLIEYLKYLKEKKSAE